MIINYGCRHSHLAVVVVVFQEDRSTHPEEGLPSRAEEPQLSFALLIRRIKIVNQVKKKKTNFTYDLNRALQHILQI